MATKKIDATLSLTEEQWGAIKAALKHRIQSLTMQIAVADEDVALDLVEWKEETGALLEEITTTLTDAGVVA